MVLTTYYISFSGVDTVWGFLFALGVETLMKEHSVCGFIRKYFNDYFFDCTRCVCGIFVKIFFLRLTTTRKPLVSSANS